MINFRKLKLVILLVLLFSLTLPAFVFANDTTSDVITELKKKEKGPLGSVQDEVNKFSRDIFNIVRLVVVAVLVVSLFMNFAAFSNAGNNPGLKAALKSKMIWAGIGAVLAINFWNIINLFTTIKILQ